VKVKDFQLVFTDPETKNRTDKSKQAWAAALNLKLDRN